eukprot:5998509-Amphidinium_carterae.1
MLGGLFGTVPNAPICNADGAANEDAMGVDIGGEGNGADIEDDCKGTDIGGDCKGVDIVDDCKGIDIGEPGQGTDIGEDCKGIDICELNKDPETAVIGWAPAHDLMTWMASKMTLLLHL